MSNWSIPFLIKKYSKATKFLLFINSTTSITKLFQHQQLSEDNNIDSILDIIFTFVQVIFQFYRHLIATYTNLSIVFSALTFKYLIDNFCKLLILNNRRKYKAKDFIIIFQQYNRMKFITDKLNKAIGYILFCSFLETLPYYATNIVKILSVSDFFAVIRYFFFLGTYLTALFIMANSVYKLRIVLMDWIGNNCLNLHFSTSNQLLSILNELKMNRISICGLGFFKITFQFISYVSLIIILY